MKSYTNIKESKKLAEILPLESADMCWCNNSIKGVSYTDEFSANLHSVEEVKDIFNSTFNEWDKYWELIPCWSLAALLDQLDDVICDNDGYEYKLEIVKEGLQYYLVYEGMLDTACYETSLYDDLIDACVEMIYILKEKNLLQC